MEITESVFVEQYTKYFPFTIRFLQTKSGHALSEDDALDLAQTTWMHAWRARETFVGAGCTFRSWVFKIATNVLFDRSRKQRRMKEPPIAVIDPLPDIPVRYDYDFERRFHDAMGMIPERGRRLVRMHYLDEMSLAEIAEVEGRPMGTVKNLIFRALEPARANAACL